MKTAEIITYEESLRRSAKELRLPWRGTEKQLETRIRKFSEGLSGFTLSLVQEFHEMNPGGGKAPTTKGGGK